MTDMMMGRMGAGARGRGAEPPSRRRAVVPMLCGVAVAGLMLAACGPTVAPGAAPGQRAALPQPLQERPVQFPPFQEFRLQNGLPVIVIEHAAQPVASVNLYVRSGGAAEPARQAGLAGMTAELLTKGTPTRTATQIAETIEGVGGSLNSSAGDDWSNVTASVLAEHLPLAFELLADVAQRPTFPQSEVELTRSRTLAALQAQLGQPGEIARRRFVREVYGEHPYGVSPVAGTVQGLQRTDLEQFHRQHFAPQNAMLVVAGAVQRAQVEELARRHFGAWQQAAGAAAAPLPQIPARQQTRVYLVHRPGSVQSNIWVGHAGVRPDDPDFFPLQVLNQILGGGVDARLFQILREEKGWTYGAYSRFTRPRDVGYFSATAEVRTEVTDSAVAEIMRQLRRLRDEPPPAADVEGAKNFLAGSFPLRMETAGQVASQIAQARLLGVPIEQVTEYADRVRAVTAAEVQRVAQQHVRPDQAAIVVVGDATQIRQRLEALAPVVLYDIEGQRLEQAALEVRAAADRFDGTRLQPHTRTYRVMVQGNPMGTATERLRREGDAWVATMNLESPMMQQESEVRFGASDLSPRTARMAGGQGATRMEINLAVADGRVRGRAELPPQAGGARDIDDEAVGGLLLPGMDPYVLAVADLREGSTLTLPVFNAMAGSVTNVTYRVSGIETVTVPAGTFSTYRVEITGAQPMTVYVRQEAPNIVVRQEFTGMPVVVELQEVR
jgi:zinc protease